MCMTDSVDDHRRRCSAASHSTSMMRSARYLSQRDHRPQTSSRLNVASTPAADLSADRYGSSPAWQHRRPGADCLRNGRPMTRFPVVERTHDPAAEGRRPATTASRRPDDDGGLSAAGFSPTLVGDVREVRRLMTALQSRIAAKDAVELIARDWRLVAACLDRALFCVYCAVVAVSLGICFPRSEAWRHVSGIQRSREDIGGRTTTHPEGFTHVALLPCMFLISEHFKGAWPRNLAKFHTSWPL